MHYGLFVRNRVKYDESDGKREDFPGRIDSFGVVGFQLSICAKKISGYSKARFGAGQKTTKTVIANDNFRGADRESLLLLP